MEDGNRITEEILIAGISAELKVSENEVKVKSFKVTEGSNKGDGYACIMKAVEVLAEAKGKERTMFYMAKCLPLNEYRANMLKEIHMFTTEIDMYTKIMPALNKLDSRISAPLTFYADAEKGVILMEDLKKQGYFLVDKKTGLEIGQIKQVLEQLALLHATSYHLIETYPNGGLEKFKEDYPNMNTYNWFDTDSNEVMKQFIHMLDQQEELFNAIIEENCGKDRPHLIQKMKKFSETKMAKLMDVHSAKGDFNCVLHNDAWCNNFMFGKNDEGVIDKIKTLDLQASRRARPTVDLAYFFGSSTKPEFRKTHLEEMLHFYHNKLISCLESLGHDRSVYPYEQMKKDYSDCYSFGYSMSQMHAMLHLTPADNKEAMLDFGELSDEQGMTKMMARYREGQLKQARTNEALRNRLIMIALEAEEMGVI